MRFVPVDHRKTDAAVVNDGMNAIREFFLLPVDTDSSKHRTNVSRLSHADIFLDCPTEKLRLVAKISDTGFISFSLIGKTNIPQRNRSPIRKFANQKFSKS